MRLNYLPLLCLSFGLAGCFGRIEEPDNRPRYRPILMSREQLESAVSGQAPRTLRVPGKIYVSGQYLFINEHYEGIHVFDNSNPSNPTEVQFLRIPGNLDMAVRGSLLYADNGPDLVTLDISDPVHIRVAGRTRNALPELAAPVRNYVVPTEFQPENRPKDALVVGWELVKK